MLDSSHLDGGRMFAVLPNVYQIAGRLRFDDYADEHDPNNDECDAHHHYVHHHDTHHHHSHHHNSHLLDIDVYNHSVSVLGLLLA